MDLNRLSITTSNESILFRIIENQSDSICFEYRAESNTGLEMFIKRLPHLLQQFEIDEMEYDACPISQLVEITNKVNQITFKRL